VVNFSTTSFATGICHCSAIRENQGWHSAIAAIYFLYNFGSSLNFFDVDLLKSYAKIGELRFQAFAVTVPAS